MLFRSEADGADPLAAPMDNAVRHQRQLMGPGRDGGQQPGLHLLLQGGGILRLPDDRALPRAIPTRCHQRRLQGGATGVDHQRGEGQWQDGFGGPMVMDCLPRS